MIEYPKRKRNRLRYYDYSKNGAYFLTVLTHKRLKLLSKIEFEEEGVRDAVAFCRVPCVELTPVGIIVRDFLENMNNVINYAYLENYCIMPNHVHLLVTLDDPDKAAVGAGTRQTSTASLTSPSDPTKAVIPRIIQSMKNLTTKRTGASLWQRSYYDHIIRNWEDFENHWLLIEDNPANWAQDEYYIVD